jgi:hypothetical protein
MHLIILTLVALTSLASAGGADEATSTPSVVSKMVQGLTDSKIDHLTSKTYTDGEQEYSYHLKIIDYLGTVQRDGLLYTIAAAKFIRSSAKGSEYPPARGHGFLLVFDDAYRIVTHGRMDYGDYYMSGNVLKFGDAVIADFGTTDATTRYRGWLLDSAFMPYPFSDKISDADWNSGKFQEKP